VRPSTTRERLAPVLDVVCIVMFIVVGAGRHDAVDDGLPWFWTVFWPLTLGWFVAALASRLYTRPNGMWLRLLVTIVVGFLVGGLLRGAFTDRPYYSIFTVVGLAFMTLTTFGWRGVWMFFERRRTLAT
jgi:hypothetical protein